ncbi:hypothetical protein [Sporosalibacterium faouarense]|uniref:hypothetical protein n=1 Tax=Sporosalibacterium faouarense TaxID=516123 RepID=UPI00192A7F2A|nr:hypothetical protein [Sporosalibacterium faouarense]
MYASFPLLDSHNILKYRKKRNIVKGNTIGEITYLRSDDILDMPSYCMFGLFNHSFKTQYFEETQKWADVKYVTRDYFKDFYDYESREEIENIPEEKQPVLLIIQSPNKFFERIYNYFEKIGIKRNEVLIWPVRYLDKSKPFMTTSQFPSELFLKDKCFEHQSEVRIVINTKNKKALKKLRSENYIINIGSLHDITQIYSYYLDDMLIEMDGMTLRHNLPEPIITDFEDLPKDELLGIAINLRNGNGKQLGVKDDNEVNSSLELIDKILKDRYGIYSYYID